MDDCLVRRVEWNQLGRIEVELFIKMSGGVRYMISIVK